MNLLERFTICRINFHPRFGNIIHVELNGEELIHLLPDEFVLRELTLKEISECGNSVIVEIDYCELLKLAHPKSYTSRYLRKKFGDEVTKNWHWKQAKEAKSYLLNCEGFIFGRAFHDSNTFRLFWKRYTFSRSLRQFLSKSLGLNPEEFEEMYWKKQEDKEISLSELIRKAREEFFVNFIHPREFLKIWEDDTERKILLSTYILKSLN
jgi:hypothetical protein